MNPLHPAPAAPSALPRTLVSAFTLRRVAIALGLAVVVAALLNPVFVTPFVVLLGRMIVIAMLLLLAFTLAGVWKTRACRASWRKCSRS